MDTKTSAVILARVSSKAQEDEGYSLDSQLKLLTNYFANKHLNVVEVFKITETASKEQSRKVFNELLVYIKKNKVYHLGVEKTDRLTRNFRDALAIDDWLQQDPNRRLHAVKENLLLHKEAGSDVKFMWNIHLAVAKKYTDNLREEAMKGWAEKLAQGWLPSPPPPGYKTITENGKRIHVPDDETRYLIQRVFKKYVEPSESINSIKCEMELLGLHTKQGRPFSKSHVHRILTNPFYIGINHFDGKEYPGAQIPIINQDLFDQVQKKLHKGRPAVYRKHNPTLKNMVHCNDCGGIVTWQLQKGRFYGACQRKDKACKNKTLLREDRVEEVVMEHLKKLACQSQDIIEWVSNSLRNEFEENIDNKNRIVTSINVQLARLRRMDDELYDDKLAGVITMEKYEAKHEQFIKEQEAFGMKILEIDNSLGMGLEKRLVILELTLKAADIYQNKTPNQKRQIISKLFKNMVDSDGSISVTYTNFTNSIAERMLKTTKLLGGKI
jgi:site-specific DNA recombinase